MKSIKLLIILAILMQLGCSSTDTKSNISNSNSKSNNSFAQQNNSNSDNKTNTSKTAEKTSNTPRQAIDSFLQNNYKGYVYRGINVSFANQLIDFDSHEVSYAIHQDTTLQIHISKNSLNKVISVKLQGFSDEKENYYWLIYELTKIQIVDAEISNSKESAFEEGQEDAKSSSEK